MAREIKFREIPFPISFGQVFYAEKDRNEKLNSFICDNYEWLKEIFKNKGLEFCYIPLMSKEIVRYNAPYLSEEQIQEAISQVPVLGDFAEDDDMPPSLLFAKYPSNNDGNTLQCIEIKTKFYRPTQNVFKQLSKEICKIIYGRSSHNKWKTFFKGVQLSAIPEEEGYYDDDISISPSIVEESLECKEIVKAEKSNADSGVKHSIGDAEDPSVVPNKMPVGGGRQYSLEVDLPQDKMDSTESAPMRDSGIRFSRRGSYAAKPIVHEADDTFDKESMLLIKEIQERIDILRNKGVNTLFLHGLIDKGEKLSRLHITKDKRILLPDYNNMEIHMSELPKAVFLLFLYHPEGIRFKELPDYRDELRAIYHSLSPRGSKEKQEKSICDVTDPMNNSINEKCARIREAFVSQFDDRLARNYYITGKQGEAKCITLDDDLITIDR